MKRAVVLALLALATTSCKKTQTTCVDPAVRPPTAAEEADMKVAAGKSATFCQELRTPKVSLEGEWLELGGRRLLGRPEIAPDKMTPLAPLTEKLIAMRTQVRELHPREDFDGLLDARFDPAVESARATSVLLEAAYHGYPRMKVTAGATSFAAVWWVRGPPDGAPPILSTLRLVPSNGKIVLEARVNRCDHDRREATADTLRDEIRALCMRHRRERPAAPWGGEGPPPEYGRCLDVVGIRADARTPFLATASILQIAIAALADQKPPPEVTIDVGGKELAYRPVRPQLEASASCGDGAF